MKEPDEVIDDEEVTYFSWTKMEHSITKATFSVSFDDVVELMKDQVKDLKEYVYIKRI